MCSFVYKVRMMENLGAAVAIIIENAENSDIMKKVMGDDGTGGGVRIPSMLIGREDGDKLLNWWL